MRAAAVINNSVLCDGELNSDKRANLLKYALQEMDGVNKIMFEIFPPLVGSENGQNGFGCTGGNRDTGDGLTRPTGSNVLMF